MKSIKRNKIAATLLLMTMAASVIEAQELTVTGPEYSPGQSITEGEISSLSYELSIPSLPRVGGVFDVTFKILCKNDLEGAKFGPNYTVTFASNAATIIKGKEYKFSGFMKKGEIKQFKAKMVINKPSPTVSIHGIINSAGWPPQGPGLLIFLIDKITGQYGTKEEYEGKLPVEYRYDPIDGSFTCSPSQNPAPVEENRKIIKMIKTLEPALSDSEALLLHSDQYRVGHPKGIPTWDKTTQTWNEQEIFEYYLKDNWFKALREGKREEWLKKEKQEIADTWKERRLNFFRADNNSSRSGQYITNRISKEFKGVWRFKDHLYNKDQGLLADAIKKGINYGRARILACYWSGGHYYRTLSSQYVTNDTGYFDIYMNIPGDASVCKAWPFIYPCGGGSDTAAPIISVSDPNNTEPSYNKDPLDPTLYVIKNWIYIIFYPNSDPVNFGVVYADTFPEVSQPNSGCINIYETYLHARAFASPLPNWPLRVMWEPGYSHGTEMNMTHYNCTDTIWTRGDTLSDYGGPDEWDDDVLLHEYGHYLMKCYAKGPASDTGDHVWPFSYENKPGIGYGEGWAHFFSCRARAGSGTDSLIVNTKKGIGANGVYTWRNIENPWLGNDFPPALFEGGAWCEGAVAGSLWDIYDSHNEVPYPSYPYPGFPDINLADTLSMGINPIWWVFDDYDPPGQADTNCATIFHFRSGWNYNNYNHAFALNQILLHHRIRDSIPAKPTGLTANLAGNYVRLYWHKNSEIDLKGYRIYRRGKLDSPNARWPPNQEFLAEKSSPTDTTHLDRTVQSGWRYRYWVTAYDILGNESEYSDSVEIAVGFYTKIQKNKPFVSLPMIISNTQELEIHINTTCKTIALEIYDCSGRIVNKQKIKLTDEDLIRFDLKDTRDNNLATGVYFIHIKTDKDEETIRKFVIIK